MSVLHLTYADLQACGFCAGGARRWFVQHGLDFKGFVRHGIAASDLPQGAQDGLSARVIAAAVSRSQQQEENRHGA